MGPHILCSSLLKLDSSLEIEIGPENIRNSSEVEFAVVWNHPEGLLLNYPNLKAISSFGHGADGLLSDKKLPKGVPIVRLTNETMSNWMSEYLVAVVLLKRRQLLKYAADPEFVEWGIAARHPGNQVGFLGLGFIPS